MSFLSVLFKGQCGFFEGIKSRSRSEKRLLSEGIAHKQRRVILTRSSESSLNLYEMDFLFWDIVCIGDVVVLDDVGIERRI